MHRLPSRRALLQTSGALAGAPAFAQQMNRPPNILVIVSDDHSVPHLGCYGEPALRTPHLDRLAGQGLRCERAYVVSPQCSPSRATLLTGRTPHAIGSSRLHAPLRPEVPSVLEALRARGYFTGLSRKHHQGEVFARRANYVGDERAFFDRLPGNAPFFLWVGYTDPHRPYRPDPQARPIDAAQVRVPAFLPDTQIVREDLAMHLQRIERLDRDCGELLATLDAKGLTSNTIVFFVGDNGMPYPRAKATLYQPGVRVPLLVRWPGQVKAGGVSQELVSSLDLPATWLDLAGAKPLPAMEGRSLRPLLLGGGQEPREFVCTERNWHDTWDPARGVVSRTHSLIFNARPEVAYRGTLDHVGEPVWTSFLDEHRAGRLKPELARLLAAPRPQFELYDLTRDPHEFVNLAGQPAHIAVEQRLRDHLDQWMQETNDFLPPPVTALPPGVRAKARGVL